MPPAFANLSIYPISAGRRTTVGSSKEARASQNIVIRRSAIIPLFSTSLRWPKNKVEQQRCN